MKMTVRLMAAIAIFVLGLSAASSFADGGSPIPPCSPGRCSAITVP